MDETIQIPGYTIEKHIGNGAMATVYLAIQQALERKVALKLMAAALVTDNAFRERFLKEGKIIAQLNHPNIVTIYDIGVFQSNYYMAMEYVEGGLTLKDRIQSGLTPEEAVDILCQVASALGYAHKRQFVHRDVKPANILLRDDGAAILSDFGIAKTLDGSTQMTQQGWSVGTPNYMSPEQALGKNIDARCDLYSLGVVFFEMLTGRKPFQAQDSFATALMHINDPIPRLPPPLAVYQDIVDRLMAKSPADRFSNADELIKSAKRLQMQLAVPDERPETLAITERFANDTIIKTRPLVAGGGTLPPQPRVQSWMMTIPVLVLLAVGGWYGWRHYWPMETVLPPQLPDPQIPQVQLSTKDQEQVAGLLKTAAANMAVEYFSGPGSAAQNYHQVLEIDHSNMEARKKLQEISQLYLKKARTSLNNKDNPDITLESVELGLFAVPDQPDLLKIKKRLSDGQASN